MTFENKKLYRSRTNKMICGVCGGIADFINLDVTVIRLILALFVFFGGAGIIAYIIAAIIIPEEPMNKMDQY